MILCHPLALEVLEPLDRPVDPQVPLVLPTQQFQVHLLIQEILAHLDFLDHPVVQLVLLVLGLQYFQDLQADQLVQQDL